MSDKWDKMMRGYCIHWCGAGYAMQEEIVKLQARVAELEAERDWWRERACRSNKHLHPDSYEKYLAVSCY